ncbi:MAG: M20/M25/M40 family metallo-hydrolase, partial [Lachnospiraceae bacterium]|nr:M20/M25/M40 family metallo-hydrolase [Lachnospiraceae bacterium]
MTDKVIGFFKDICAIPHGSGNCSGVGDYLVRFAKDRGLEYVRDPKGNVLIRGAAVGAANDPAKTVILQGHQDMVCVRTDDCQLDMAKDSLDLRIENGMIFAAGTSLGADDGIGVAMALAVLDDTQNPHPPIEALFTVDEETGMSGAAEFDTSCLVGKKLINLDSEEEGVVTCACAGGERLDVKIPLSKSIHLASNPTPSEMGWIRIHVSGLAGGHSGCDIHKGRLSALRVITDLLGKM